MKKSSIFQLLIVALVFFSACSSKLSSGMTLYTVRDDMKKDPKAVLKTVADIGYKNIEATDYANRKFYGMTPVEFKDYLHSLGLNPSVRIKAAQIMTIWTTQLRMSKQRVLNIWSFLCRQWDILNMMQRPKLWAWTPIWILWLNF